MSTEPAYTFAKIPDVEVYPCKFTTSSKESVGCKKTHSDVMLTIHYHHSTDDGFNGKVYIFLDEHQLVDLINTLDKALVKFKMST